MASIRKREWVTPKGEQKSAWVVDYIDQGGKRRLKTFARRKDADDWRTKSQHEISHGVHTPESASVTLKEAGERWIRSAETVGELERSTIRQRRQHLDLHIKPYFGNKRLSKITTPMVNQYVEWLMENGRSRAMAVKVLTSLKAVLSYSQGQGLVASNAAREVKFEIKRRHKKRVQIPSKNNIKNLVDKAQGRWRPIILTAVFTGLRASEIRGLTWQDVDFDAGTIEVRQRADRWNQIGSPKSEAAVRKIPVAPIVLNTLREWKLICPHGELGLVFPNGKGNVETQSNIWRRGFVPLMGECELVEENGAPQFSFHTLRHVAASLFIEQGWSPKRVQTVMGHATMAMTYDTYGHLFPNDADDAKSVREIQERLLG